MSAAPSATPDDGGFITLAEAAEHLDVHYMTAYRWVRTGLLDATKHGGQWRVHVDDLKAPERRPPGRRSGATPDSPSVEELEPMAERLAGRLLVGDEPGAWAVLQDALAGGLDPVDVHVGLLAPAMRVVGDRWEAGSVSVGDEHRATSVATRLVGRQGPLFRRPGTPRATVAIGAVEGDRHALPVSLLADVLRQRGLAVVDLGADAPASSFLSVIPPHPVPKESIDVLALGMTVKGNRRVKPLIAEIRAARPGLPILIGGAAVHDARQAQRLGADGWTGTTAVDAADAIEQLVKSHANKGDVR